MLIYYKLSQLLTAEERRQVPLLLFFMIIGMIFEVVGVGVVIPIIALMTKPDFCANYENWLSMIGHPTQTQLVIFSMMLLAGLYLVKAACSVYLTWKQNKFIFDVQANLSGRLFMGYLNQPWTFHLARNSAQLILNITNEVSVLIETALQPGLVLITEGLVLLGVAVFMCCVSPIITLTVVIVFGLIAYILQHFSRKHIVRWGQARQHHEGLRVQHLQQGLGGAKDIKLLGREKDFFDQYNYHNLGYGQVGKKQKTLSELPRLWLELLANLGLVVTVLLMIAQNKTLDSLVPMLAFFAAAAFRLMPSINRLLGAVQNIRYCVPVINTLHDEIKLFNDVRPIIQNKNTLIFEHALTLEHVSFKYENTKTYVLDNLSLSISRGSSVGFIGASGAGKTSLIDVVLGLLPPEKGCVNVDGVSIYDNLRAWQNLIGYVPQTIYLIDDSVRRNIAFGLSNDLIDDAAVRRAVKAAQLEQFISNLPDGLDTLVGERGIRLSGGQRQRIGIARALYHEPEVLVLDEATSALDLDTEKEVMNAIDMLQGSKTLIIIAHRLSTVARCDRVYKIKNGQIIAEGDFDAVTQLEKPAIA